MSDFPQTPLSPHKRGDTWQGIGSITINRNGAPLDLTGAEINMHLRRKATHGMITAEWTTDDETITITNAAAGIFKVHGRELDIPAYTYAYDIQLTLPSDVDYPDGRVLTIAQGTWEITQDVTR